MSKTDIAKNGLYIKRIINVIKADNPNHHRLLSVNGRHSDAFVYIVSGSCTYGFEDEKKFTVREGDILYLAHGAVYTMYIHSENYRFIFCDFEFDSDCARKSADYSAKNISDAENLFNKLLKFHTSPSKTSFAESMAMLYDIYGVVLAASDSTYIERSAKNKISDAGKYIDANYKSELLSVDFLAERTGMSTVYFRKLFKAQYGISPSQYIISVRLKKAKEFMKYPFLTLEECAGQSGFSSLQYFCRAFKKATGTTPAAYRNKK